ncbi:MAG: PilN domain-containing protein [Thioalkalivibrionaceae bacterium]
MIRINLLPWREKARERRKKEFHVMLGVGVVIGALLVAGAWKFMADSIAHQEARNELLQREIREMDRRIAEIRDIDQRRQALIDRMDVIQTLQAQRPEIVRLFDQMVTVLPAGTYLTEIRQTGRSLQLVGRAESNARISSYMRSIDRSDWLGGANLQIIETRQDGRLQVRDFRLQAEQRSPSSSRATDQEGAE